MQSYVDDGKLPCVSILIIKDGKQVDRALYGYENIEEQRPLKEDAIFRIYSMSKPITTVSLTRTACKSLKATRLTRPALDTRPR